MLTKDTVFQKLWKKPTTSGQRRQLVEQIVQTPPPQVLTLAQSERVGIFIAECSVEFPNLSHNISHFINQVELIQSDPQYCEMLVQFCTGLAVGGYYLLKTMHTPSLSMFISRYSCCPVPNDVLSGSDGHELLQPPCRSYFIMLGQFYERVAGFAGVQLTVAQTAEHFTNTVDPHKFADYDCKHTGTVTNCSLTTGQTKIQLLQFKFFSHVQTFEGECYTIRDLQELEVCCWLNMSINHRFFAEVSAKLTSECLKQLQHDHLNALQRNLLLITRAFTQNQLEFSETEFQVLVDNHILHCDINMWDSLEISIEELLDCLCQKYTKQCKQLMQFLFYSQKNLFNASIANCISKEPDYLIHVISLISNPKQHIGQIKQQLKQICGILIQIMEFDQTFKIVDDNKIEIITNQMIKIISYLEKEQIPEFLNFAHAITRFVQVQLISLLYHIDQINEIDIPDIEILSKRLNDLISTENDKIIFHSNHLSPLSVYLMCLSLCNEKTRRKYLQVFECQVLMELQLANIPFKYCTDLFHAYICGKCKIIKGQNQIQPETKYIYNQQLFTLIQSLPFEYFWTFLTFNQNFYVEFAQYAGIKGFTYSLRQLQSQNLINIYQQCIHVQEFDDKAIENNDQLILLVSIVQSQKLKRLLLTKINQLEDKQMQYLTPHNKNPRNYQIFQLQKQQLISLQKVFSMTTFVQFNNCQHPFIQIICQNIRVYLQFDDNQLHLTFKTSEKQQQIDTFSTYLNSHELSFLCIIVSTDNEEVNVVMYVNQQCLYQKCVQLANQQILTVETLESENKFFNFRYTYEYIPFAAIQQLSNFDNITDITEVNTGITTHNKNKQFSFTDSIIPYQLAIFTKYDVFTAINLYSNSCSVIESPSIRIEDHTQMNRKSFQLRRRNCQQFFNLSCNQLKINYIINQQLVLNDNDHEIVKGEQCVFQGERSHYFSYLINQMNNYQPQRLYPIQTIKFNCLDIFSIFRQCDFNNNIESKKIIELFGAQVSCQDNLQATLILCEAIQHLVKVKHTEKIVVFLQFFKEKIFCMAISEISQLVIDEQSFIAALNTFYTLILQNISENLLNWKNQNILQHIIVFPVSQHQKSAITLHLLLYGEKRHIKQLFQQNNFKIFLDVFNILQYLEQRIDKSMIDPELVKFIDTNLIQLKISVPLFLVINESYIFDLAIQCLNCQICQNFEQYIDCLQIVLACLKKVEFKNEFSKLFGTLGKGFKPNQLQLQYVDLLLNKTDNLRIQLYMLRLFNTNNDMIPKLLLAAKNFEIPIEINQCTSSVQNLRQQKPKIVLGTENSENKIFIELEDPNYNHLFEFKYILDTNDVEKSSESDYIFVLLLNFDPVPIDAILILVDQLLKYNPKQCKNIILGVILLSNIYCSLQLRTTILNKICSQYLGDNESINIKTSRIQNFLGGKNTILFFELLASCIMYQIIQNCNEDSCENASDDQQVAQQYLIHIFLQFGSQSTIIRQQYVQLLSYYSYRYPTIYFTLKLLKTAQKFNWNCFQSASRKSISQNYIVTIQTINQQIQNIPETPFEQATTIDHNQFDILRSLNTCTYDSFQNQVEITDESQALNENELIEIEFVCSIIWLYTKAQQNVEIQQQESYKIIINFIQQIIDTQKLNIVMQPYQLSTKEKARIYQILSNSSNDLALQKISFAWMKLWQSELYACNKLIQVILNNLKIKLESSKTQKIDDILYPKNIKISDYDKLVFQSKYNQYLIRQQQRNAASGLFKNYMSLNNNLQQIQQYFKIEQKLNIELQGRLLRDNEVCLHVFDVIINDMTLWGCEAVVCIMQNGLYIIPHVKQQIKMCQMTPSGPCFILNQASCQAADINNIYLQSKQKQLIKHVLFSEILSVTRKSFSAQPDSLEIATIHGVLISLTFQNFKNCANEKLATYDRIKETEIQVSYLMKNLININIYPVLFGSVANRELFIIYLLNKCQISNDIGGVDFIEHIEQQEQYQGSFIEIWKLLEKLIPRSSKQRVQAMMFTYKKLCTKQYLEKSVAMPLESRRPISLLTSFPHLLWDNNSKSTQDNNSICSVKSSIVDNWLHGKSSTYDFLSQINIVSQRSLLNINNYFIFPWLDGRDLKYPPPAQKDTDRCSLIEKYENSNLFQLATLPSSSASTIYYCVRMQPFETAMRMLQSGKYDSTDRMFRSLEVAWNIATNSKVSDCKELVPDLFQMPILINFMGYDFGQLQTGEKLDDVRIDAPLWMLEYIEKLNSREVRFDIIYWIQQVFGDLQRKIDLCNVYPALNYFESADYDTVNAFGIVPKRINFEYQQPVPTDTIFDDIEKIISKFKQVQSNKIPKVSTSKTKFISQPAPSVSYPCISCINPIKCVQRCEDLIVCEEKNGRFSIYFREKLIRQECIDVDAWVLFNSLIIFSQESLLSVQVAYTGDILWYCDYSEQFGELNGLISTSYLSVATDQNFIVFQRGNMILIISQAAMIMVSGVLQCQNRAIMVQNFCFYIMQPENDQVVVWKLNYNQLTKVKQTFGLKEGNYDGNIDFSNVHPMLRPYQQIGGAQHSITHKITDTCSIQIVAVIICDGCITSMCIDDGFLCWE